MHNTSAITAEITEQFVDNYQIFTFRGPFTYTTKIDYAGRVIPYIKPEREIAFDLSNITEMDTVFLGGLIKILRAIRDNKLISQGRELQVWIDSHPKFAEMVRIYNCKKVLRELCAT